LGAVPAGGMDRTRWARALITRWRWGRGYTGAGWDCHCRRPDLWHGKIILEDGWIFLQSHC
jgi:hypothetical protein